MDLANNTVYTCEGTWKTYDGTMDERPVLFLTKKDAMSFINEVLYLENCGHIQPAPWEI